MAIALAAVLTVYVVATTPLHLDNYPYYEAHGLSIAAFANRELGWPEGRIETALIVVCALALIFAVAIRSLRIDSRAYHVVAATGAAIVVAWSLTTQVYAAEGELDLSNRTATNFTKPYDWVDRATGGKSVVVIGQQISDPTNVWLTEFFNASIRKMWSLDGSAINVGAPILTPDLEASDGTLTPSPETQYALALNGVELQAPVVEHHGQDTLYRLDGGPDEARRRGDRARVGRVGGRDERRPGRPRVVYEVRRLARRAGLRDREALAPRVVPEAAGQDESSRSHRSGGHWPRQAAGYCTHPGHPTRHDQGLHDDPGGVRDADRPVADRGGNRTDGDAARSRSDQQRAAEAGRDDVDPARAALQALVAEGDRRPRLAQEVVGFCRALAILRTP